MSCPVRYPAGGYQNHYELSSGEHEYCEQISWKCCQFLAIWLLVYKVVPLTNSLPHFSVSICYLIFSSSNSNSEAEGGEGEEESMSEGEMASLMEEVEEKKKLIADIRNKPWRMKRRLTHLK